MTIKKIEIKNIKGIENSTFELDIIANRPSLLVAPNGFGKSSFAAAFISLLQNRLSVDEDNYHKGNSDLPSELSIEYEDDEARVHSLSANSEINEIRDHFSWFVINNQIKAKGVGRRFGGRNIVSASIDVEPIVLVDTIPVQESFDYNYTEQKRHFGANGKVLPNITNFPKSSSFIKGICNYFRELDRINQVRNSRAIADIIHSINQQNGTAYQLLTWIEGNKMDAFEAIDPLKQIAELILSSKLDINERRDAYLAALQISQIYSNDSAKFKRAQKRADYLIEKEGSVQNSVSFR